MFVKSVAVLVFGVAVVLVLSGCAGGAAGNAISVTTTDFKFEPTTWTIPAAQTINLTLVNRGANEHEWVLLKQGTDVTLPFDDDDEDKVYWEIEAAPGETKAESFTSPTAGTYKIVCGIAGHLEQGMQGSLVVQ
jgi:uncharacterized cupredoxin-like copper-binding protein